MCLLIAGIQASQRSRDPQSDIGAQGLSFGATHLKGMRLTCPHILKNILRITPSLWEDAQYLQQQSR